VAAAERWLAAVWPVVHSRLPAPPAQVVEIGCGLLGGFVPMLRSRGYEAVGVDPEAPDEAGYRRVEFESVEPFWDVEAVVASTSLHHVADPAGVIDRIARTLARGGTLVVVEWDWEAFDEPTAEWCFQRLGSDEEAGWLHRRRDEWMASGQPWCLYLREWAAEEQLHAAGTLVRLLDERFDREHLADGPYFFPDLAETAEEEEQAAIDAGQIRATRVDYVGRLR
jgi:SAM-dependent methyltransferase